MSFLKKLLGGGGGTGDGSPKVLAEEGYGGFTIRAVEMRTGSEYQLCGEVTTTVDGEAKTHKFIRADRLPSADEAASSTLAKGRQIIDEQGPGLFN